MPKIIKKQEALLFQGVTISELLNKQFLDKMNEKKLLAEPVTLVFMITDTKDGKKNFFPIILSHEDRKEIEGKITHISTEESEASELFIKVLEEMESK